MGKSFSFLGMELFGKPCSLFRELAILQMNVLESLEYIKWPGILEYTV
jgi:hypothetical protein